MSKCFDLLRGIGTVVIVAMVGATIWATIVGVMTQGWIITEVLALLMFFIISGVISNWEMKEQEERKRRESYLGK